MRWFKYARRLILKEWLPIIAVFLIVSVFTAIIAVANHDFYHDGNFSAAMFSWPVSVFALVLPFFVFSYRYNKIGGDTYYQLPYKEKNFKRLRVLTGLTAVLFVFIVTFIIGYLAFVITYLTGPASKTFYAFDFNAGTWRDVSVPKIEINPAFLAITFPIGLVFLTGIYFTTTAIVNLTNRLLSAMILVIVVQVFLAGLVPALALYVMSLVSGSYETAWANIALCYLTFNPGASGISVLFSQFGNGTAFCQEGAGGNIFDKISNDLENDVPESLVATIVTLVIDAIIYVGAGLSTLLSKEPSGEFNGTGGTRNKYLDFFIYSITLVVALASENIAENNPLLYALIVVFFIPGLYIMTSIFLGTFKVGIPHAVAIGISGTFLILLPFLTIGIQMIGLGI